MNSNFNQELMQDFLEKIIQARKERAMIIATEHGMLERVAKMIDNAISCFQNMGLKVKSDRGIVRWWLTTTDAKVESYSSAEIEVKLGFACSPAEMKGKVRLTKKEAEIAAELQKIWDKSVRYGYFYDCEKFRDLAAKLSVLTHHLRCYKVLMYDFDLDNIYLKENLLAKHYNLGELSDEIYNMASTRDLVRIKVLFG
jgi:hypothetical protein